VLVNNSEIYPRSLALDMSYDLWKHVLGVNLGGTFLCRCAVAPAMLKHGEGVIINIVSGLALQDVRKGIHYAESKTGTISLTKSLPVEWAPHIRVNTVIPGVTETAQPRQSGVTDTELYARGAKIPLKRIGPPQDTAWAVEYLVSPRATYITGQSLCVIGGSIMQ
jgi:3-oxoacyl-[acyl-carrier protein] reductase